MNSKNAAWLLVVLVLFGAVVCVVASFAPGAQEFVARFGASSIAGRRLVPGIVAAAVVTPWVAGVVTIVWVIVSVLKRIFA